MPNRGWQELRSDDAPLIAIRDGSDAASRLS
jgi:hypothetical protein